MIMTSLNALLPAAAQPVALCQSNCCLTSLQFLKLTLTLLTQRGCDFQQKLNSMPRKPKSSLICTLLLLSGPGGVH